MPDVLGRPQLWTPRYGRRAWVPSKAAAWSPLSLPNLGAWYDASDTATIVESGGAVSQWNDKSGNGFHATQGTAGSKPITGSRMVNGLNGLDWDGLNDFMTASIGDLAQPTTVYWVISVDAANETGLFDSTDGAKRNIVLFNSTPQWIGYAGSLSASGGTPTTGAQHGVAVFNGASSQLYINGTLAAGASGNWGAQNISGLTIGWDQAHSTGTTSYSLDGIYCELVIQHALGSAGDRTNWNSYVARWGL